MGVEPFLISSSVIMIIAQRLVRKICEYCKTTIHDEAIPDHTSTEMLISKDTFYKGTGCDRCNNSGYKGRIGVFEILTISNAIKDLIERRATTQEIIDQAKKEGFKTLFEDALDKVQAGLISLEEAIKITVGSL